ncbi:MauE/DoxX family redox-associated membrane protein [Carbonactinospora thermoautotrophica]|nr:MauE/DoxX family redox-associated membrane protein [Carbonactinospora thermoautotrophica]
MSAEMRTEGDVEAAVAAAPARTRALPWISTLVRVALAGIFGAAGLLKIGDPNGSVRAVQAYQLFPNNVAQLIGYALPFLEIALALVLLVGLATRFAAVVGGLLLLAFIGGVASAWARGLSIDCGCFGGGGQVAPGETRYLEEILRDIGFLVLAAWLAFFPRSRFTLDR